MEAELIARIEARGLGRVREALLGVARTAIRLATMPAADEALPVGASKMGGRPDLPPEVSWPTWKGQPQAFIGQFRMEDLAPYDTESVLPRTGMLYVFYDAEQSTWGFDPKDRGSWRTIYFNGDLATLQRRGPDAEPAPAPPRPWWQRLFGRKAVVAETEAPYLFSACAVSFSAVLTLPDPAVLEISHTLTDQELEAYCELIEEDAHQFLGHPNLVQNPMEEEVAMVTHGIYCGNAEGWDTPRALAAREKAGEWRLLLQIASDDHAGMMWGDVGFLYFWIRNEDLWTRNFDETWMVLQCA